MNRPLFNIGWKMIGKKLAVIALLAGTAASSFATLGDGNKKTTSSTSSLLSARVNKKPGTFSLRSGYTYRGTQVINQQSADRYVTINTSVSYQRGNTTYIVPLKKKVFLSNVTFDISNRQLRRN